MTDTSKHCEVHLLSQSAPMLFDAPANTYTKDGMFCVMMNRQGSIKVYKFPLCNIFRVTETEQKEGDT